MKAIRHLSFYIFQRIIGNLFYKLTGCQTGLSSVRTYRCCRQQLMDTVSGFPPVSKISLLIIAIIWNCQNKLCPHVTQLVTSRKLLASVCRFDCLLFGPIFTAPTQKAILQPEISYTVGEKNEGSDLLMIVPLSWMMFGNGLTAPTLHCFSICLPYGLTTYRLTLRQECS